MSKMRVHGSPIRAELLHAGMEIEDFFNNLCDNLGLIDTKLDVHCITGERRGKLPYPLKNNVRLTNTCALVIRDFPDGVEIIGE